MRNVTQIGEERITLWQWGCLGILFVAIVIVVAVGIWLFSQTPTPPRDPRPTAIVWTATPTLTPTSTPNPTPTRKPTTPLPLGEIAVGIRVRVSNTGNAGLSIRASAGLSGERLDIASENETFIVVSGPKEADDLTWWFLRDESNPTREGWAAANYLRPEQ